ncbi:MAG: hypothetical protein GXX11_07535, partial [Acholeplasmataceae bacterium]|nr:hypothetical protein [Acholeplasmataceae bacterium]
MKHFYVLGSDTYPVFVLKKAPLTTEESEKLYNLAIEEFGFNPMSTYFPLLGKGKLLNSFLVSMETGQLSVSEAVKDVESYGYDISPVTDNNPFFYKLEKGIPKTLVLVMRLSLLILMLVILIPLVIYREKSTKISFKKNIATYILTVLFLGMGFMLVEISLLQKFILFFGEPVISIAVLLSSILLGAGLGSLFSNRITPDKTWIAITRSLVCLCIVLILYVIFLPGFLQALLEFKLWKRLIVAFAMLLPLGFIMGIPFPLAIRSLKLYEKEEYIPWLLGINCLSSVMGSSLATVISIG